MSRPTRFEGFQFLGDKLQPGRLRLSTATIPRLRRVAELVASEQFAAFGPDTLAEARNRGYRPYLSANRVD